VSPIIVISDRDNVATALEALAVGRAVSPNLTVTEAIPRGHKIALCAIADGTSVIKYGNPIGVATADIPAGAHVHTHNLSSARGRGDLATRPPVEARLAEPPDDRTSLGDLRPEPERSLR
jgi:altronate dehydratase